MLNIYKKKSIILIWRNQTSLFSKLNQIKQHNYKKLKTESKKYQKFKKIFNKKYLNSSMPEILSIKKKSKNTSPINKNI
jgi:hypothetical protein